MAARLIMKLDVVEAARSDDVLFLTLRHPRRPRLPEPEPGAHVDVHLPDGRVRQYSLCGDPDDPSAYRIAVKREAEGRGGSTWLHDNVKPGDTLMTSAPRNHFELADADRFLLIAGGIGVTPFVPMAQRLSRQRRDFTLHYCARAANPPFAPILREACGAGRLTEHFTEAGGPRLDLPSVLAEPSATTHVYCCGPRRLMDAVRDAALHWPQDNIHFEAFEALDDAGFAPEPFEVEIASSGAVLLVPADKSALDIVRAHGVDLPSSCEIGVCGSCECGYRDGEVIHRDVVLSPRKRKERMMLCVSRARGRVVLDL